MQLICNCPLGYHGGNSGDLGPGGLSDASSPEILKDCAEWKAAWFTAGDWPLGEAFLRGLQSTILSPGSAYWTVEVREVGIISPRWYCEKEAPTSSQLAGAMGWPNRATVEDLLFVQTPVSLLIPATHAVLLSQRVTFSSLSPMSTFTILLPFVTGFCSLRRSPQLS